MYEREREQEAGGEAEEAGEREGVLSRLNAECRAQCWTWDHNPEMVTWAENQEPDT